MYPYHTSGIFSAEGGMGIHDREDMMEHLRRFFAENEREGYLSFRISTAQGAFPVRSAKITVTKDLGDGYQVSLTLAADESGNIERVRLPAPSRAGALSTGTARPYAAYDVQVSAPEYVTKRLEGVAIIEGITSLQPVELQPMLIRGGAE